MKWLSFIIIASIIIFTFLWLVKTTEYFLISTKQTHFVQRRGTSLILANKTFILKGVNDYDLAYTNNQTIDHTFSLLHAIGVTTIRFWLFGEGIPDGFQPQKGVYNEQRFKQADYILYDAQKYHMHVIPVLSNNWKDYGGKEQYLAWANKNSSDDSLFYTDTTTKDLFEKYIAYVLSRKNSYTHITYATDTAILGWDIMNEPRSSNQEAMNSFLISLASFIKQRDNNHLVFAGTEVSSVINPTPKDLGKSSDLCANPTIDICSVHLYLFNNTQPLFNSYSDVLQFLTDQEQYAQGVNKPVVMEEFGIANTTKPFGEDQLPVMTQIVQEAKNDNFSGVLMWDWSQTHASPFTFSEEIKNSYSVTTLQQLLSIF